MTEFLIFTDLRIVDKAIFFNISEKDKEIVQSYFLDKENEIAILSLIESLKKHKTIILISHTPNLISFSDTILNLKEGKILKSLYRTATDLEIQSSIIIDFARIYGFWEIVQTP